MEKLKNTELKPGEQPSDFYSWGDVTNTGIISKKEQFDEKLEGAFDSIEIKEDLETPETDYVLKVLGKEAGRVVIPFDVVVKNAYYDTARKEIVIVFSTAQGEKEVRVNVEDLVDTYTGDNFTIKVENNVISITDEVMGKFVELESSIKDEEIRAGLIEKSLLAEINSEKERAELAEKNNADAIAKIESDYKEADEALKSELEKEFEDKDKNNVKWQYSTEYRKHIVLDNHDNILGTSTEGGTYNLAMVSKWDVVDIGSNKLPLNLNSTNGKVTINDNIDVLTTENTISKSEIESLFQ